MWRKWRACDLGEAKKGFENELWRRWSNGKVGEWALEALLILQPFRHFTYVPAHSPILPSVYLRHSSFCNPSVASPTSQLFLETLLSHLLRHRLFTCHQANRPCFFFILHTSYWFYRKSVREGSTQWDIKIFPFFFFQIPYFKNGKFVIYWKIWSICYAAIYYKTLSNVF